MLREHRRAIVVDAKARSGTAMLDAARRFGKCCLYIAALEGPQIPLESSGLPQSSIKFLSKPALSRGFHRTKCKPNLKLKPH